MSEKGRAYLKMAPQSYLQNFLNSPRCHLPPENRVLAAFPAFCLQTEEAAAFLSLIQLFGHCQASQARLWAPRAGAGTQLSQRSRPTAGLRRRLGLLFKVIEFSGLETHCLHEKNQPPHFCQMIKILSEKALLRIAGSRGKTCPEITPGLHLRPLCTLNFW